MMLCQQTIKLAFTPRKVALLKDSKCFVVVESDHNTDAAAGTPPVTR